MKLPNLLMGCLSSRSTIVPAVKRTAENKQRNDKDQTGEIQVGRLKELRISEGALGGHSDSITSTDNITGKVNSASSRDRMRSDAAQKKKLADANGLDNYENEEGEEDDDMISILIDEQNDGSSTIRERQKRNSVMNESNSTDTTSRGAQGRRRIKGSNRLRQMGDSFKTDIDETSETNKQINYSEGSVQDEAIHIDLLRQYIMVDHEIGLLEDKDALRVYHEKIEQLEQFEQFERELDMIRSDAEEVATRSDSKGLLNDLLSKDDGLMGALGINKETKDLEDSQKPPEETESNSMLSAILPQKLWLRKKPPIPKPATPKTSPQKSKETTSLNSENKPDSKGSNDVQYDESVADRSKRHGIRQRGKRTSQYSTVEEVFNRKIVLEKQRDKLKKEVEMAIVECDKLQQRYKKRDEILDKLFEGRTGNGLENHLEQQLNWLLEQKHYVDQVYYVWKRAETLTNQTCEQFANALDLIKRLPEVEDAAEQDELVKNIGSLMIKSRQGMEQAQKYNPNVDAPFFTDNETERFDKIIEKISTNSLNQSEYSQILTVVQFAYKRAVSIRLWLEQILQTTIARDSFELAEEYKWIAIQLRKERINLIKAKLNSEPYRQLVQELREQMAHQFFNGNISKHIHEINRDSGIGSETKEVDLEEEVYRILEMNKSRFLDNIAKNAAEPPNSTEHLVGLHSTSGDIRPDQFKIESEPNNTTLEGTESTGLDNLLKVNSFPSPEPQLSYHQIKQRMRELADAGNSSQSMNTSNGDGRGYLNPSSILSEPSNPTAMKPRLITETPIFDTNAGRLLETPTRLRIELDEKARLTLLQQVDQIHSNHRKRIERLRGSNKAIATSSLMNRLQGARSAASHHIKEMVANSTSGSI